jgi:hypothetical protein
MQGQWLFAAFLSVALCAAQAQARAGAPSEIKASYNVHLNGTHVAVMNERFEAAGGRYEIVSDAAPVGVFRLFQPRPARFVSSGRIAEQGLQPERFEGSRGANDARRVTAEFDWGSARLTLSHDGKNDNVGLPAGTQDRLSIMYQLMFLAHDKLQRLDFAMTNGRKLDRYTYVATPNAEIDTPLGRMTTLHLVRQRNAGDSGTEIWLAPQHGYLPVRLVIRESDGARYEQVVTKLEVKP